MTYDPHRGFQLIAPGRMVGAIARVLVISTITVLVSCHRVCFIGSEYDPQSGTPPRWFLSYNDPCECTVVRLGGMRIPASSYRQGAPHYLESLFVSEDTAEIRAFFGCKECNSTHTVSQYKHTFPFPAFNDEEFTLNFSVQGTSPYSPAIVVVSKDDTAAGTKFQLVMGRDKIVIRRCTQCSQLRSVPSPGLLSELEMRRFWLRYQHGILTLGKHQQAAFFEWTDSTLLATPVRFYGFLGWGKSRTWVTYYNCHQVHSTKGPCGIQFARSCI